MRSFPQEEVHHTYLVTCSVCRAALEEASQPICQTSSSKPGSISYNPKSREAAPFLPAWVDSGFCCFLLSPVQPWGPWYVSSHQRGSRMFSVRRRSFHITAGRILKLGIVPYASSTWSGSYEQPVQGFSRTNHICSQKGGVFHMQGTRCTCTCTCNPL